MSFWFKIFLSIIILEYLSDFVDASSHVEEFQVYGPMDLHGAAMEVYIKLRKETNEDSMNENSQFMIRAKDRAIKRMMMKPEEELILKNGIVAINDKSDNQGFDVLKLPTPEGRDAYLSAAVNQQSASNGIIISPETSAAQALTFLEDVGIGAISRAGALPMGTNGEWLKFAENKLKKENSLDYQSLLWELGTESVENKQIESGGLNVTNEELLLSNMMDWFTKGGGKLQFVKPIVTSKGFKLVASEDFLNNDAAISVPLNLIMCQQTARNVLIKQRGRYLGEELQKTFEKNEVWGIAIFLLHEYYKEVSGNGSKWGPFIRTLRMRQLTTEALHEIKGTTAAELTKQWMKSSDSFMWWSVGSDGPCSPTTGICRTKPNDKVGDNRFNNHQMRWAYWVVKQNCVRVRHATTGFEFLALIPYYNMMDKVLDIGGEVTFDRDGLVNVRVGGNYEEGTPIGIHPGNFSDSEFFVRYLRVPKHENPNNVMKLSLPGSIPKGSKFHYCLKGSERQRNSDECRGSYRSESMFWKSKVLTEWREQMNLPPRLQELRMWATRLHLYGGNEEMKLLSAANQIIAGLPIPVDQMPAEEQLMLLGIAKNAEDAALIVQGPVVDRPLPQLYSAPDPEDDYEAQRSMENLAYFAAKVQNVINSGNFGLNATQIVLNHTKNFFLHGVLPMAGLDELDEFLLKKIGMISHCGYENDMKIVQNNITNELFCAMRVHLMNESEVNVFCPADVRVWQENCMDVEFLNYTAISLTNEMNVITALRGSIHGLLGSYTTSIDDDKKYLKEYEDNNNINSIIYDAIRLRIREKELLFNALNFLYIHEQLVLNGTIPFQLELKAKEREEADLRHKEYEKFLEDMREKANQPSHIAILEVDLGANQPKYNLTLEEGKDIKDTIIIFCNNYNISLNNIEKLESALRKRVINPPPLKLILGVVTPLGTRNILGITDGSNITIETNIFCIKFNITKNDCNNLEKRVNARLIDITFQRNPLVVMTIDSPDTRKLKLVLYEGEQHDLFQFVNDFFEYYHLPKASYEIVVQEVHKRLPGIALTIPIGLGSQRQVSIRLSLNENITNTIEGFVNFYELDDNVKLAITKRALHGMNPGSYLV